jgi:putative NADH-flavin reductase
MKSIESSKIAILGATGKAGSVILNSLLENGFQVKALIRNQNKIKIKENALLQIMSGDATNETIIKELLSGCNVIINAISNTNNSIPILSKVTKSILLYMQDSSNTQYIGLTGKTIKEKTERLSFNTFFQSLILKMLFPKIINDKQKEYRILKESNINWTLLRCPRIVDGNNCNYSISLEMSKGKSITKMGISAFIINEIRHKQYLKKAPYIYT